MFYSDKPIQSSQEDQLGRNGSAKLLAQSLLGDITQLHGGPLDRGNEGCHWRPISNNCYLGKHHGSSAIRKPADFRAVLQSLANTEIPMSASGRWANAGMVRGGGRDVCWRLLDAQHWADPRLARRQRVFVVADFGGRRAGAVLFKPRRLFPAPAPCGDFGLPPAGGNRISAFETGGPLPVVHPFQGYRMRGAAKAGDVGNFLGSFGKSTDPFPTLLAGGLTVFALWREGREAEGVITWLTPTEGERAMGLPDGWTAFGHDGRPVSARARQKALGNSIALPCAEYIMAGVKEELEGGKPYSDI